MMKALQTMLARDGALDMIAKCRGVSNALEINPRAIIAPLSLPRTTGPWNTNLPKALEDDVFGKANGRVRSVASINFAGLRAELFLDKRTGRGVNAADIIQLAKARIGS